MSINRNLIIGFSIIVILAMSRLIPHPPNFTPILGMAFFAGAVFDKKVYAYLITIFAMLLSDLFLGFHAGMFVIYFSLCLCVLIGTYMSSRLSVITGIIGISSGVLLFYLIMILNIIILFSHVFNMLLHVRMIQRGTTTGNHLGKLEGIVSCRSNVRHTLI